MFHVGGNYTYFYQKVSYVGIKDGCYVFTTLKGAKLLIDTNNTHLIYTKY